MHVNPLHPVFAAEVTGIDFTAPSQRQPVRDLHEAIHRHGVVVFRNDRPPTDEQHVAFSRLFWPVEVRAGSGNLHRALSGVSA